MDLMYGQLLIENIKIRSGSYKDLKDIPVLLVTAAWNKNPSMNQDWNY